MHEARGARGTNTRAGRTEIKCFGGFTASFVPPLRFETKPTDMSILLYSLGGEVTCAYKDKGYAQAKNYFWPSG